MPKRSHFCQKVIKKLKQQVKDLNEKLSDPISASIHQTQSLRVLDHSQRHGGAGPLSCRNRGAKVFQSFDGPAAGNDELISFLEHKLEEVERALNRTRKEYDLLQVDYLEIRNQQSNNTEKYKRAALLLTEYLDDILTQTPNILEDSSDMHLNLEKIKSVPMAHLGKEDKVALVLVLLKQLQPYLSANNLQTSPPPHPPVLDGSGKLI